MFFFGGNPISFYDPYGLCKCSSVKDTASQFINQTAENYNNTKNTIDNAVTNATHTSLMSVETGFSLVLGGFVAKSYNGSTALQEGIRIAKIKLNAPRSQFNLVPRYDTGRVFATTAINMIAINAAWNGGLMIGSGITTLIQGVNCD